MKINSQLETRHKLNLIDNYSFQNDELYLNIGNKYLTPNKYIKIYVGKGQIILQKAIAK